jgi:RNA polymerase subunit RPABC4/transcription elongation factor Spt4
MSLTLKVFVGLSVLLVLIMLSLFALDRYQPETPIAENPTSTSIPGQDEEGSVDTPTAPEDEMPAGQGKVRVGISKSGSAFGLSITLDKIVEDSRCPVDVECVWAGRLIAEATLQADGQSKTITLETDKIMEWYGYSIVIASVEPIAKSTEVRKPEDYFLTFVVTPRRSL